jgi:ATP-binding cassette, subfamily B, bacterial
MKTWQFVLHLWRYRSRLLILNAVIWIVVLIAPIITGLVLQQFFDVISEGEAAISSVWSLLALFITIEIAHIFIDFFRQFSQVEIEFSIGSLLRKNVFWQILHHKGARALPASPGEAVSRVKGDTGEIMSSIWYPISLLGQVISAVIALFIMARTHLTITLVVFIPILFVVTVSQLGRGRIERYRRASRQSTGNISGFLGEIFGAVQAIQVANAQRSVLSRFSEINAIRQQDTIRDRMFTSILDAIYQNAVSIGTGIILLLAAQSMREGEFTVGDFALFEFYMGWVTLLPFWAGWLLSRYKQLGVAFERLKVLMPEVPPAELVRHGPIYISGEYPELPYPIKTDEDHLQDLKVCDLTYHYPESERGVDNISFSLKRGSFTVVTGRIGSGKTTLLRVLLGLLPADTGEIYWIWQTRC